MRISVIIPCYNMAGYLKDCIKSVLGQTFKEYEIVVVDDASTDGSDIVAQSLLEDPDIFSIMPKNSGPAAARNTALDQATGDWILPLDADDRLTPDALYEFAMAINADPDADLIVPQVHRKGAGVDAIHRHAWKGYEALKKQNFLPNSCCYRRDAALRIGGYRDGTMYEDWEFWIRLLQPGPDDQKIINIPKVLIEYTVRLDSRCHKADEHYQEECAKIRQRNPKLFGR